MVEFKILMYLVNYMESTGSTYKTIRFDVDHEFLTAINDSCDCLFTQTEIEAAVDKCLAHEWIERKALGGNRYNNLSITPKGIGAAISKKRSEELRSSRSWLKKISDYIEDHKGLFVMLSFIIALATFTLNIYWKR